MYTHCPDCKTVFEVTAQDLAAAGGHVVCGECGTTFSALETLSESIPDQWFEDSSGAGTIRTARAPDQGPEQDRPASDDDPGMDDVAQRIDDGVDHDDAHAGTESDTHTQIDSPADETDTPTDAVEEDDARDSDAAVATDKDDTGEDTTHDDDSVDDALHDDESDKDEDASSEDETGEDTTHDDDSVDDALHDDESDKDEDASSEDETGEDTTHDDDSVDDALHDDESDKDEDASSEDETGEDTTHDDDSLDDALHDDESDKDEDASSEDETGEDTTHDDDSLDDALHDDESDKDEDDVPDATADIEQTRDDHDDQNEPHESADDEPREPADDELPEIAFLDTDEVDDDDWPFVALDTETSLDDVVGTDDARSVEIDPAFVGPPPDARPAVPSDTGQWSIDDEAVDARDLREYLLDERPRPLRTALLGIGSLLLLGGLAAQFVHTVRNELAMHPTVGPYLAQAYGRMGLELDPDWDVAQYRFIGNSSVVDPRAADAEASQGPDILVLNASFENRTDSRRPYPLLRVVLRNRWTDVVAARDFDPADYLPDIADPDTLMLARERVLVRLHMVDPGEDVVGYDLDTCLDGTRTGMRCTNDVVMR